MEILQLKFVIKKEEVEDETVKQPRKAGRQAVVESEGFLIVRLVKSI